MSNRINFRQISKLWKEEKRNFVKYSTMSIYEIILEKHLLPTFSKCHKIEEESVQQFVIEKLKTGLTQKTVRDILNVLKMIVRFGSKHANFKYPDWEIKFPTNQTKKEPEIFTLHNQQKLIRFLKTNLTLKNLGVLICINTGMRIGEICALKWSDIDVVRGVIVINKTIERLYILKDKSPHTELVISSPKTNSSYREIPMTHELIKLIKPLKMVTDNDCYVVTNTLKPTEPRTYRDYFKRLLKKVGIPGHNFHSLRHSFATRCIESQCDYKTVSVILGHSNISTTLNLYVHPNMSQKRRCIEKMSKILNN